MLYVTDLGKIVLASSCVALHCGKPVVYTDGYCIKRPVFTTTISSDASSSTTTTTIMKQSSKVVFACKESEEKEQNTISQSPSLLLSQVANNVKASINNSSEIGDLYFTAHITFDAKLQQPTFTITRSDQPSVKKYLCSHNPNKAWKSALCDVLHDFPDRVPQMTCAVVENGVFTRGITCFGLHLNDVSRALQELPLYHNLITLWEADKNKNANSQVLVEEKEEEYVKSKNINLNTSANINDNAYVLVNSQTSTISVNSTNTPSLHKRGRTSNNSEGARQRKVTQGTSRRRGSQTLETTTTTPTVNDNVSSTNTNNTSLQQRPSLSLTCSVCGLTNVPFCAVTGAVHASSITFSINNTNDTNNTNDKPICTKCGLCSVVCPVTGTPHIMSSDANNTNPISTINSDNAALSLDGQRQGRKRGEVHLPKNSTRAVRRTRRPVQSVVHSRDVVAEINNELLQPKQRKPRKARATRQTLAPTSSINTTVINTENQEMYIKDDDNDSSDDATHVVQLEEEDLPLCEMNQFHWSIKDERSNDGNNKRARKRSQPVSVKSTQECTPRAPSRTSVSSAHASQSMTMERTRSRSRQSKTPTRSLPLSQQNDNKEMKISAGSNNNASVSDDAAHVHLSQDKGITNLNGPQDAIAANVNSTIGATSEKSIQKSLGKANLENTAELEEMPLADLMLQEVYVYPPLKSPLPQSEQTKAAAILQQRWRTELGSVLLPPQHETLALPMLTSRRNVNTNQSTNSNNSTKTFTSMASAVVQPAKRGRRKIKAEYNNEDNIKVNNVNEAASGETKDEKKNSSIEADNRNNENSNSVNNIRESEVSTENKLTVSTNDKADDDASEAATMPSSPLQDVSSPTSTCTDNAGNTTTIMYPLQINNTATSVAVKRYLNFLWQYTSERTKQEALKSMTTMVNGATVKDGSESATLQRKTRRNAKSKAENKEMKEEQEEEEEMEVKAEVATNVMDSIDDAAKNEVAKTEASEVFVEPVAMLDDHAMAVTSDAAEMTESTL